MSYELIDLKIDYENIGVREDEVPKYDLSNGTVLKCIGAEIFTIRHKETGEISSFQNVKWFEEYGDEWYEPYFTGEFNILGFANWLPQYSESNYLGCNGNSDEEISENERQFFELLNNYVEESNSFYSVTLNLTSGQETFVGNSAIVQFLIRNKNSNKIFLYNVIIPKKIYKDKILKGQPDFSEWFEQQSITRMNQPTLVYKLEEYYNVKIS